MSISNLKWPDSARVGLDRGYGGARALGHLIQNPQCDLLLTLTALGVPPAAIAEVLSGEPVREGQSPFAIALGNIFERELMEAEYLRLTALYREGRGWVLDRTDNLDRHRAVRLPPHPKPEHYDALAREMAEVVAKTEDLILLRARGAPNAPDLIVHPLLVLQVGNNTFYVEADYLVAGPGARAYRPGEIKAMAWRDGETPQADLTAATRQAAVARLALRQTMQRLGISQVADLLGPAALADIILKNPRGMQGVLREQSVEREIIVLERVFRGFQPRINGIQRLVQMDSLKDPAVVGGIPIDYRSSCLSHCAMAPVCRERARQEGDPRFFHRRMEEALRQRVGSFQRLLNLDRGAAVARDDGEASALAEYQSLYRAAERLVS